MNKLCLLGVLLVGNTFIGCKSKSQGSKATPAETGENGAANPTGNGDSKNTPVSPGPDSTVTGGKIEGGKEFCLASMIKSVSGDNGVTAEIGQKYYLNISDPNASIAVPDPRSQSTINPMDGFTAIRLSFDSFRTNCDPKIVDLPFAHVAIDDVPMFLEENFSTRVCTIPKGTYFPWNDDTAFTQSPAGTPETGGYVKIVSAHENMPLACRGKTVYAQRRLLVRANLKF